MGEVTRGAIRPARRLLVLVPAAVVLVLMTALLGPAWLPLEKIFSPTDPSYIFWHLRVPRSILAGLAGAGLAVGGVVFQALFRNPLAEPYTLGVASGASLGAAGGMLLGWGGSIAGVPVLNALALGGALAALGLALLLGRVRGRDMTRVLLAGVCVAYLCSAGILLVTYVSDRAVTNDIVRWMMGSLGVLNPAAAWQIAAVLGPVLVLLAIQHRALDLLQFGDDLAASRGVNVDATIAGCFLLVGLLTAVIVANCGPIGFVGLMVPHMGRALVGGRTLPLLAGSALVGAAFLAACDGLARTLPVVELPVGVVTSLVGAVFFFALLTRREASGAGSPI